MPVRRSSFGMSSGFLSEQGLCQTCPLLGAQPHVADVPAYFDRPSRERPPWLVPVQPLKDLQPTFLKQVVHPVVGIRVYTDCHPNPRTELPHQLLQQLRVTGAETLNVDRLRNRSAPWSDGLISDLPHPHPPSPPGAASPCSSSTSHRPGMPNRYAPPCDHHRRGSRGSPSPTTGPPWPPVPSRGRTRFRRVLR